VAGESADAVATRKLQRARRLEQSASRYRRGAAGERATALALDGLPAGWVVLHDVRWPGRQRANIDHVLVGPPGVVVLDSKNWSARVRVEDGRLQAGGRDRSTSVWGVEAAVTAVAAAVPGLPPDDVHAALCFTGQVDLDAFVGSVLVTSDAALVPALLARPARLTPRQVWDHAELVRAALGPADGSRATPHPSPRQSRSRHGSRTSAPPVLAAPPAGTAHPRRSRPARRRVRAVRRLLVGAAVATILVTQPQALQAAADAVGSFVTGAATPPSNDAEVPTADRPTAQERREVQQPRRERERQERRERREARQAQQAGPAGQAGQTPQTAGGR